LATINKGFIRNSGCYSIISTYYDVGKRLHLCYRIS